MEKGIPLVNKSSEKNLSRKESVSVELIQEALEMASVSCLVVDESLTIQYSTDSARTLLNVKSQSLTGLRLADLFNEDHFNSLLDQLKETKAGSSLMCHLQFESTVIKIMVKSQDSNFIFLLSPLQENDAGLSWLTKIRKHIVVVDDEPIMASLLSELLKKQGHETVIFYQGREALKWITDHIDSVAMVLSDHFMPDISGIDLATELFTLEKRIPVVLCTGDKDIIERQRRGEISIKHFISKPVDEEKLKMVVNNALLDS